LFVQLGATPLFVASRFGHAPIVKELLAKQAAADKETSVSSFCILVEGFQVLS